MAPPKTGLKRRLKDGALTVGSWVTLGHPSVIDIMARAGFDWLVIDMEHSVITEPDTQALIQVADGFLTPTIVRLTSNDANQIKRVMDSGAHGVMAPSINSVDDARQLLDAVYYPPRGKRGTGLARAQAYGSGFHDYRAWLEDNALVIVMLEHVDAVNVAEDILKLDGIDGYMIGPYDLSASLGRAGQFDDPEVVAAISAIREAGDRAKKPGGIHIVDPNKDKLESFVKDGFRFIGYGVDIRFLDGACRNGITDLEQVK